MQHFAATPTAAGWARRHTADVLARWQVSELAEDAMLVVSELVSNAVLHADTPKGTPACCRLVLKLFAGAVAVEVWDPSPGGDVGPREADVLAESGRGLAIVESLCGTPPLVFIEPGRGKTIVALIPWSAE